MSEQGANARLQALQRSLASPTSGEGALRRRLVEALLTPVEPPRMTYEEFLAWADEDTLAEWIALPGEAVGEVIMTSPASKRHQDISSFLASVIGVYIRSRDLGVLYTAPFQMKLEHGREPDLLFVKQENIDRLKQNYLDGPADLVIEIVSPESIGRDRGEKFYEYAQGGVTEYWLIDPQMEWAEFYQLKQERYHLNLSGKEGRYQALTLPGFWLRLEWLWQDPPPSPIRTLAEIVGMDASLLEAFERALAEE